MNISVIPGQEFYRVQENPEKVIEAIFYSTFPGTLEIIVKPFQKEVRLKCGPTKEEREIICKEIRRLIQEREEGS